MPELGGQLVVLGGELDERVEVLDVVGDRPPRLEAPRHPRVLGADLRRAPASSQKPGSPICVSSAAARSASEAGSKIVREQLQLVANCRDASRVGSSGALVMRRGSA